MVFGSIFPKSARNRREESVRALAQALNTLDYDRVANLVSEDLVVFNPRRGTTRSRDEFIEQDRLFRQSAGSPQIEIADLIHHGEEILISGLLKSDNPDVGGPTMWRVGFDGFLISEVEITRADMR